jgi:hypothetical protein
MDKKILWLCVSVGGVVGSFVPYLWGDTSLLSVSGVIFSAVGGFLGIWVGFKLT